MHFNYDDAGYFNKLINSYPLQFLVGPQRKVAFVLLLVCYFVARTMMSQASQVFNNELTVLGIVSFEFAASRAIAEAFLHSWNAEQLLAVVRHTQFDFLYLLAYGLLASLLCETISRQAGANRFAVIGMYLSWGACIAALLDAFENAGILTILSIGPAQPLPALVASAAAIKFLLIIPALLYVLAAIPYFMLLRLQGKQR